MNFPMNFPTCHVRAPGLGTGSAEMTSSRLWDYSDTNHPLSATKFKEKSLQQAANRGGINNLERLTKTHPTELYELGVQLTV